MMNKKLIFLGINFRTIFLTEVFMKIFFTSFLLLASFKAQAFLTSSQQDSVLGQLNDICADAWCESSIDFIFKNIECSVKSSKCTLIFSTQENYNENQPLQMAACTLPDLKSEDEIFENTVTGTSDSSVNFLKDSFIEKVNLCLEPFIQ